MLIDNGATLVPYGMVAVAGRPVDKIGPFEFVGWDELRTPAVGNPKARLGEQDRDGVAAEVFIQPVGSFTPPCKLFTDWRLQARLLRGLQAPRIAEYQAEAPQRPVGIGQTALRSVEEGIEDLSASRASDCACRVPGSRGVPRRRRLRRRRWRPVPGGAAEPSSAALSFHILRRAATTGLTRSQARLKMNSFGIIRGCQDIIGTLIFGGVPERVPPGLERSCACRSRRWLGRALTYRADHALTHHRNWFGHATLVGSLRFRANTSAPTFLVTFRRRLGSCSRLLHLVNYERLLWASDHPHVD